MSLVPMCSTTSVAPGTSATSRPIRTRGDSPPTWPRSARSSLREIPALSTAIVAAPPRRARRSDSASDQRESVSSPLPTPSVIESPIATSALTGRGARTSTPVSTIHDPTGVANAAPPASREKSPEPDRYDVCSATGCSATTSGVLASTRLTAIGRPASATTGTGSLTSSAPGATTASERPAKATGATVPGTRAAPEPARAADTGPDGERGRPEPVGQPHAHLRTRDLRADDHAQGAPGERLGGRHGLRAGLPGGDPGRVRTGRPARPGPSTGTSGPTRCRPRSPGCRAPLREASHPGRRPSAPHAVRHPSGTSVRAALASGTRTGGTPPAARPPRAAQRAGSLEREWAERVSPVNVLIDGYGTDGWRAIEA